MIELIVDTNCISFNFFMVMANKLTHDLENKKVKIVSVSSNEERMNRLGVKILPVWIFDDEILFVNPTDYNSIKKKIEQKINQQKS
ncbi:hypothetical protein H8E88_22540 [candidate division KSB1 bacterium]|nr:hypothetical protein [candidate division KSB1 bacterium]